MSDGHQKKEEGFTSILENLCFQRGDSNFSKAQYFNDLIKEREVALARPQGGPLTLWKDLKVMGLSQITLLTSTRHS